MSLKSYLLKVLGVDRQPQHVDREMRRLLWSMYENNRTHHLSDQFEVFACRETDLDPSRFIEWVKEDMELRSPQSGFFAGAFFGYFVIWANCLSPEVPSDSDLFYVIHWRESCGLKPTVDGPS